MYEKFIQWLPILVVFIAGAFALHQIRSNNITNARIKWLENLKQIISDFFSECAILQLKWGLLQRIDEESKLTTTNQNIQSFYDKINDSIIDNLKIIESKHDLIKLNLNPKENLHLKFENILDIYMRIIDEIPSNKNLEKYEGLVKGLAAYSETLKLLIRYIMKLEWEKTKRSYLSKYCYMKFGKGKKILKEAMSLKEKF